MLELKVIKIFQNMPKFTQVLTIGLRHQSSVYMLLRHVPLGKAEIMLFLEVMEKQFGANRLESETVFYSK